MRAQPMAERQSLMAIEERLEIEDVPVTVEVRQEYLAPTEAADEAHKRL